MLQKNRPGDQAGANTLEIIETRLTNASASESAVTLHTHLAAAEKIGDCCYGLFGVLCARTDGED